jgi:hypothetical protein
VLPELTLMGKWRPKKPSVGQRLLTTATRFLFPGDARHSRSHVNHERWGDRRTRQYKERVDRTTAEVRGGNVREIHGHELRNHRQRESNYPSQRDKW